MHYKQHAFHQSVGRIFYSNRWSNYKPHLWTLLSFHKQRQLFWDWQQCRALSRECFLECYSGSCDNSGKHFNFVSNSEKNTTLHLPSKLLLGNLAVTDLGAGISSRSTDACCLLCCQSERNYSIHTGLCWHVLACVPILARSCLNELILAPGWDVVK